MTILSTLKRTLTFHFLLVASVPVFLFGLVNIQILYESQFSSARENNRKFAQDIRIETEAFLREIQTDLSLVDRTLITSGVLQKGGMDPFLDLAVGGSQFFESIFVLDAGKTVVGLGSLNRDTTWRADYERLDLSQHPLFSGSEPFKGPRWSNTFISPLTGEPSVTLGVPSEKGYLFGNISLARLSLLLQKYAVQGDIEITIVDRGGTVIAHNDLLMVRQRVNYGNRAAIHEALEGRGATREHASGGRVTLESSVPIASTGWVVAVNRDMDDILAPIRAMRNLLFGFMALAVLLAVAFALLNLKRVMRPLAALGEHAEQIAGGRYGYDFQASGYAEIDELADRLSSMSRAIQVREDSIITSERRFRDLVNSIDGIVWEMEYPSFRFLFVSRQAESMLGYPLQDWCSVPDFWESKVHPDDVRQAKAYCQLMTEKQQDHNFEYRMLAIDGRTVWVRDLVTVVIERGRPVRLLGVMIDVTLQKELIEDLKRSEQNYREIFNASSEAIFIHDAVTGRVIDVNRAMLDMYRCTYEEALRGGAAQFSEGVSPYSEKEAREHIRLAMENGSTTFTWRARRASGELFWAEVSLQRGMIGGRQRILAVVRDVTQRRKTESELASYRSHLEILVRERTRQLEDAQAELVQKERLAVLGRLTATVSHEIRNPLGTIANALYMLREGIENNECGTLQRPLTLAERNVARCDNIISELLDFSRQREPERFPLEVDAWLGDVLEEMMLPDELAKEWELASGVTLHVDSERLRRAVINAVTNALHALDDVPQTDRVLRVVTRVRGGRCEIVVADTGPGMGPEVLARIFEPMYSTKNFGVGLGVPVIRNVMESHGGGVDYRSEPGKGTSVTLWMPLDEAGSEPPRDVAGT